MGHDVGEILNMLTVPDEDADDVLKGKVFEIVEVGMRLFVNILEQDYRDVRNDIREIQQRVMQLVVPIVQSDQPI